MQRFLLGLVLATGLLVCGSALASTFMDFSHSGLGPRNSQQFAGPGAIGNDWPGARGGVGLGPNGRFLTSWPALEIRLNDRTPIRRRLLRAGPRSGMGLFGRRSFVWHPETPGDAVDLWQVLNRFPTLGRSPQDFQGRFIPVGRFPGDLSNDHSNDISDKQIENFRVVVIPEPNTAVLLGAGLLGVGLWRRRSR
ncbi:MAG: PEP-CTERM sorting domain-containing protein [Deltaproteobacteria bacterium]|nr:PEP-CTERM sorting domain-containing protein [Deltaproteobacteria bacterium]